MQLHGEYYVLRPSGEKNFGMGCRRLVVVDGYKTKHEAQVAARSLAVEGHDALIVRHDELWCAD